MDQSLERLSTSIERLAHSIGELAKALNAQDHEIRADTQALLDLTLHNSQRIARRLRVLDAQTPPAPGGLGTTHE